MFGRNKPPQVHKPRLSKLGSTIPSNSAAKLDRHLPGWEHFIDTDMLDLNSNTHCILGQLSAMPQVQNFITSYFWPMTIMSRDYAATSLYLRTRGWDISLAASGFIGMGDVHTGWVYEVKKRRLSAEQEAWYAKQEAKARAKAAKHLRIVPVPEPTPEFELVA